MPPSTEPSLMDRTRSDEDEDAPLFHEAGRHKHRKKSSWLTGCCRVKHKDIRESSAQKYGIIPPTERPPKARSASLGEPVKSMVKAAPKAKPSAKPRPKGRGSKEGLSDSGEGSPAKSVSVSYESQVSGKASPARRRSMKKKTEKKIDKSGSQKDGKKKTAQPSLITQVTKESESVTRRGRDAADTVDLGDFALPEYLKGPFLGVPREEDVSKKTLVLDLDETLVHSSFQPVSCADFVLPVEIEGFTYDIYVATRPGVHEFLAFCAELFEVVIFTASLAKYADPLMDRLDPDGLCAYRLFRESCLPWEGVYVKDLSRLGRELAHVVIVDNSPACSMLQPDNSLPIRSWFDDPTDRELYDLMPILRALAHVDNIPDVLRRITACEDEYQDSDSPG